MLHRKREFKKSLFVLHLILGFIAPKVGRMRKIVNMSSVSRYDDKDQAICDYYNNACLI